MPKGKVEPVKNPPPKRQVEVDEISFPEDLELPPIMKESKYPWGMLAAHPPKKKSFFVKCSDKQSAEDIRSSIFSSGRNYYLKRKINRVPVCRVMQINDVWGVGAQAWEDETKPKE